MCNMNFIALLNKLNVKQWGDNNYIMLHQLNGLLLLLYSH